MPIGIDVCQTAANFSEQGRGTPKDFKRALGFLKHGCDEADKRSCARMGHIFTRTNPPNVERARSFYKKACDLGDPDSCKALQALP
jgi:TPR repeat protein